MTGPLNTAKVNQHPWAKGVPRSQVLGIILDFAAEVTRNLPPMNFNGSGPRRPSPAVHIFHFSHLMWVPGCWCRQLQLAVLVTFTWVWPKQLEFPECELSAGARRNFEEQRAPQRSWWWCQVVWTSDAVELRREVWTWHHSAARVQFQVTACQLRMKQISTGKESVNSNTSYL